MIAGSQTIAEDRRGSQKIEHGSIFCDLLRSSGITIAGSQTIAEVCFHMIVDDRRTFCDLRSYGNQPLTSSLICDFMSKGMSVKNKILVTCVTHARCKSSVELFVGPRSFSKGFLQGSPIFLPPQCKYKYS